MVGLGRDGVGAVGQEAARPPGPGRRVIKGGARPVPLTRVEAQGRDRKGTEEPTVAHRGRRSKKLSLKSWVEGSVGPDTKRAPFVSSTARTRPKTRRAVGAHFDGDGGG